MVAEDFANVERIAREQRGVFDPIGGAALHTLAVESRGLAIADHELAEDRLIDAAEHGLPMVEERNQRAPKRDTGDEALGAVDGIEHPDEFGLLVFVAVFFTDDAVLGLTWRLKGCFVQTKPSLSACDLWRLGKNFAP